MADDGPSDPWSGAFPSGTALHGGGPGDGIADAPYCASSFVEEFDRSDSCVRDADRAPGDFTGVIFEFSGYWDTSARAELGFTGGGRRKVGEYRGELLVDGVFSQFSAGSDAFMFEFCR